MTDSVESRGAATQKRAQGDPPCTCHPDDNPPVPCPKMYSLSDCKAEAYDALRERLAEAEAARDSYGEIIKEQDARLAEVDQLREELKLRECEGPAHVCHNLATERAEVRRLLKWQQEMIDAVNSGKVYRIRALIEEARHE